MSSSRNVIIWMITAAIFVFGMVQGYSVSVRKPLWNDELYSQVSSVEGMSWPGVWLGGIQEGNNAPLFYAVQKAVCQLTGFKGGDLWHKQNLAGMIILRVAPVFFMSFALAFIFWFFARTYSMAMGGAALLLSLGTYLVWGYWAEARPYAMIFAITAVQAVVLMHAFRSKDHAQGWKSVAAVHVVLAFTSPLSVIQVSASALILWMAGYRRFISLFMMIVVPVGVGLWFHFAYKVHYNFWFAPHGQPLALLKSAIPGARFPFLILAPLVLWIWAKRSGQKVDRHVWLFMGWVFSTLAGYGVFLLYLWLKQKPEVGFEVSNRYMMALAPIGVVAVMFLCVEFFRIAKSIWAQVLVWVIIGILVLPRVPKIFSWAMTLY